MKFLNKKTVLVVACILSAIPMQFYPSIPILGPMNFFESKILASNPDILGWNITRGFDETDEEAYGVALDSAGNVIIGGIFQNDPGVNASFFVSKFTSNGVLIWETILDYSGYASAADYSMGLDVDSNNDIYISGIYDGDVILVKLNAGGNELWNKTWGETLRNDICFDLCVDKVNHFIYVVGATQAGPLFDPTYDIFVLKYNSMGSLKWNATLGTEDADEFGGAITVDDEGHVFVTGWYDESVSIFVHEYALLLAQINSSTGESEWSILWYSNQWLGGKDIVVDLNDDICVGGFANAQESIFVGKFNKTGALKWNQTWNDGLIECKGYGIAIDANNDILVCGNMGHEMYNISIVKFNATGFYQNHTSEGTYFDSCSAYGIVINEQNHIYIAGSARGVSFDTDALLMKYGSSSGSSSIPPTVPGYDVMTIIPIALIAIIFIGITLRKKNH